MRHFLTFFLLLFITSGLHAYEPESEINEVDSTALLLEGLTGEAFKTPVNKIFMPHVFTGYRHLTGRPKLGRIPDPKVIRRIYEDMLRAEVDTLVIDPEVIAEIEAPRDTLFVDSIYIAPSREDLPVAFGSAVPDWLKNSIEAYRWQEDFLYRSMMSRPNTIEYAYWDLPERPRLPEEDFSFTGYLKRLNVPEITPEEELPVHANGTRINWLHTFNISLQLSQSYISANWYQGGSSFLAFFGNFLWDVVLNKVYYPNTLFQSTVSYKLAINSTPEDEYHKYQVSQDLFQYNLKAGYKAYHNWYYSFALLFKTQFLNSYPADSPVRAASFLSPGELNAGIGMTYSKENKKKTVKFTATISPLSYNLKTCIDKHVNGADFGVNPPKKTLNEFGSNAEVNFSAKFASIITYTTRAFFFTDYHGIETDWENTLNFQFSKLFSTQIYAHLRYDTKADPNLSPKWGKLMMKEILSVGLSYNFSTK